MGVHLSFAAVGEFNARPVCFVFCAVDFLDCAPVLRHNLPFVHLADAMLVYLQAEEAEKNTYELQVKQDAPSLYFPLKDRKGTRELNNKGTLPSHELGAQIAPSCALERTGPMVTFDKLSRSVFFDPPSKSRIDCKYHPHVVPPGPAGAFSLELYVKCTGGLGTRCAVMSGRYGIQVNREDEWIFVYIEGIHDLHVKISPMVVNEWVHLVCTFDGTTVRCYKNALLQASLEVEGPLIQKQKNRAAELEEKKQTLLAEEADARDAQKVESLKEAEKYFKTREGLAEMKRAMQVIMESFEFQSKNIGAEEKDHNSAARAKKTEALKQAKQDYSTELYIKNVREVAGRYAALRDEVDEEQQRDVVAGESRAQRGLRIGASCATSVASHYFLGYIAQVLQCPP
jgi:hypothetical protein